MNIFGVMIQLKNSGRTMLAVRGLLVACGGMAAAEEEPPGDWYPQSDFAGQYRAQFVNEALGTYNHHMVVSFEFSITKVLNFDVSWIWDRIANPRSGADGITPKPDDIRTAVGLSLEF